MLKETYYFTYLFTDLPSSARITDEFRVLRNFLARPSTECSW